MLLCSSCVLHRALCQTPVVQLRLLLPSEHWLWSATYVTTLHPIDAPDGMRGLHAVTAVSAASVTAQLYVSEAEAVFKNVCGQDGDFLKSMPTEEEEEEAAVIPAIPAAETETERALGNQPHALEEPSSVTSSVASAATQSN